MIMNVSMRKMLDRLATGSIELPPDLAEVFTLGLVEQRGCIFLASLLNKSGNGQRESFPDDVGFECFVNHFHIDSDKQSDALRIALVCVKKIEGLWSKSRIGGGMRIIVSTDRVTTTVRFHLLRANECWLNEDLETYRDEAVLYSDCASGWDE